MKKLLRVLKWGFIIWGAISLFLVLGLILFGVSTFGLKEADRIDQTEAKDVRFVLNWCGLGEDRMSGLLHSYESARSMTGDHLDAYAIRVKSLSAVELPEARSSADGGWIRGDKLDPVTTEAVRLASGFTRADKLPWFPAEADLLSEKFHVWVWSIGLHGRQPYATKIIFADPDSATIYYASCKM